MSPSEVKVERNKKTTPMFRENLFYYVGLEGKCIMLEKDMFKY